MGTKVIVVPFPLSGHENMARDAELLALAESGGVYARIYRWGGAWVSLGRFQRAEKALIDLASINWVVRPTGGKAVLHGHDVTVSIAANLDDIGLHENYARRVASVYRRIVEPLACALTASGISAVLAEKTSHVRNAGHTADCFAHVSPNDVVDPVTGEKVCGCALRLTQSAVLLQASVPVGLPLVDPALVFEYPSIAGKRRCLDESRLANELMARLEATIARRPVTP